MTYKAIVALSIKSCLGRCVPCRITHGAYKNVQQRPDNMPINTRELLDAVAILTDKQSMRVTLKSSAKGATVAGSSTFLGGLLAGPAGLFVGGAVGGLIAYAMTNNQFKPVSHIIRHDLTVQEQEQLKQRIVDALSEFHPTDLMVILPLLTGNLDAQQTVVATVVSFLTNEMRMQIID